jgi:hypothetical protein
MACPTSPEARKAEGLRCGLASYTDIGLERSRSCDRASRKHKTLDQSPVPCKHAR